MRQPRRESHDPDHRGIDNPWGSSSLSHRVRWAKRPRGTDGQPDAHSRRVTRAFDVKPLIGVTGTDDKASPARLEHRAEGRAHGDARRLDPCRLDAQGHPHAAPQHDGGGAPGHHDARRGLQDHLGRDHRS